MNGRRRGPPAPDFATGGRRIAWFFGAIGAAFAVATAWSAWDAAAIGGAGVAATARVVAIHREERRLTPGEPGFTRGAVRPYEVPELEFRTADGRTVHVRGGSADSDTWAVGDTVDLRYLPANPGIVEFEAGDQWFLTGLFAVFAVAFSLPLLFLVVLPALRRKQSPRR